jgi:Flp pilus assembly protein TadG
MNLPTNRASSGARRDARDKESGQSLVELALVVALMLAMTMAVFDLGRAFYAYMSVVHAAREGARAAMDCGNTNGDVTAAAANATSLTVSISVSMSACSSDGWSRSGQSTVTVTHDFQWVTPVIDAWTAPGSSLAMTSTMRSR